MNATIRSASVCIAALVFACTLGACGSEPVTEKQAITPGDTNPQVKPLTSVPIPPEQSPTTP